MMMEKSLIKAKEATTAIHSVPSNEPKTEMELRLSSPLEKLWYADRPFPCFTVKLYDTSTGKRVKADDLKMSVTLRNGFGNDASDKLSESIRTHSFVMHSGTVNIASLRFCGVSSKAGGFFQLVLTVKTKDGDEIASIAPFISDKIKVLSYRLYHAPKVDTNKLRPEDVVSKMKGIGSQYAKRLANLGIQRIDQLAAIKMEAYGEDECSELIQCLRKDRGALTQAKLESYIHEARAICYRYGGNTLSRQTHTVARSATSDAQPNKRRRSSTGSNTDFITSEDAVKRIKEMVIRPSVCS